MRKSLQTRLTVYFIALVLIPLLIVGAIVTWQTYRSEVPHALESQDQIAQRVAEQVRSFIEGRETELHSLTDINDFSNATREEQTVLLSNLFSDQTVYEELILTNGQGRELIFLSRLKVVTPGEFSNRAGSEEFDKPKETNATYFSPVSFNEVTGEPYMVVSVPLLDLRSGKLEYVLIAKFRFKSVWDLMAQAGVTGESAVYMTDNNGFVVAHANPSFVLKRAQITPPAENSFTTGLSGTSVALAFSKIAFGDQTFYVLSEQPASEALSLAFKNIILTIITTLLAIVVAGFLGVLAARQITTPIAELATTAQLISEGDLTTRTTQVDNEDEIGALATAFNRMTSQLRDLIGSLEQRVAERTKALSSVAEVGIAASTILERDKLLQQVVDLTKERFNLYHAHIYLLNEAGDTLVLASGAGAAGKQMVAEGRSIPLDREQSLVARAARERKGVTVNDVTQAPDFLPNPLLPDTHAELAVPMIVGENVIGVFDVQSETVGRFTDADIAVQTTLSSQVAIAVQNANQYEETKTALTQSEKLFNASDRLSQATNLQELVKSIVESLGIHAIDRAILGSLAYDDKGELDGMTIVANWSQSAELPASPIDTHYSRNMLSSLSMFTSIEPLFFSDVLNDKRVDEATRVIAQKVNYRSVAALPIFIGSRRDAIVLLEGQQPHNFTQAEIRLLVSLGPQFAAILENRRQFERTQEQAKREAMINVIAQKIQSAPSIEAAMKITARELGHALGMKATVVSLDSSAPAGEVMKKKEIAQ